MRFSGTQAADFIKVLGPTLQKANLTLGITCCDAEGWSSQAGMLGQLSGVDTYLSTITAHAYTSAPGSPMNTRHRVWQTEAADLNGNWQAGFYAGGGAGDGITWANNIHTALVNANASAYLYWIGAQTGTTNSKLIRLDGDNVAPSKRLWAFGQFSRAARPGAVRVGVQGLPANVRAAGFRNVDGSVSVVFINGGAAAASVQVRTSGGDAFAAAAARAFVTDNEHDLEETAVSLGDAGASMGIPARSMVSIILT